MARPAKAEVNLSALRDNYRLAKTLAPESQSIAVIKANGYGHGAVPVAKALEAEVPAFGVACIEEALELRDAGISVPILLLEGCFTADELPLADAHNFWVAVENQSQVDAVVNANVAKPLQIWLKIDTGMHRLGASPDDVESLYRQLAVSENVASSMVLMSHLACGDELDRDDTPKQVRCYDAALEKVALVADELGLAIETSLGNSAGVLAWSQCRRNWNRPGYMLYGGSPFTGAQENARQLKPVMTLKTGVIGLRYVAEGEYVGYGANWCASRPSRIATLAMGYADGYPRVVKPGTPVLIHGQRAPIVGNVSMDMITIDVTDVEGVELADEVVMWGEGLPIDELAAYANTIGYELIARMPLRVPRVYLDE